MTTMTRDETPVVVSNEAGVEVRSRPIGGDLAVSYIRLPAGTDMSIPLKGLPDDQCQCPHWGFLTKGRMKLHTGHGDEIYEAGQAYYWAPGHAPEALEDSELMEFSPADDFAKVLDHVKEQVG
ncbi:cupin domain-containing protein [Streptomyces millisiae]|uniref:Cupin domain-containing protein n=1 Tax=Streptomyces millisiae TaxID=3075542 RepID=A0ABU2LKE5_9ACTN|nr:hypothetical protein [Streptomyces sp. DSM 44918]MDT0318016.1 hypothetical protein [Streptomyces sp. DSM 44918]